MKERINNIYQSFIKAKINTSCTKEESTRMFYSAKNSRAGTADINKNRRYKVVNNNNNETDVKSYSGNGGGITS